jgi:hypothetical protein
VFQLEFITYVIPILRNKVPIHGYVGIYNPYFPALNVSTNLANYLILAADSGPAVSANNILASNETDLDQGMAKALANAEEELQNVLRIQKIDIYQLFKAIAVR